uniref:Trypsin-like peptidase domain protein n=1 Tax=Mimivirus LCMiAC01 TaxID=2506608 RepID=A0A481Z126_9VIRU|nr:MAG: trypsin-like peptidase domain protein [Mimivirus LCMiAC01]
MIADTKRSSKYINNNKQLIISAYVESENLTPWNNKNEKYVRTGLGTPILLDNNLYILTCFHVVKNAYKLFAFNLVSNDDGVSIQLCREQVSVECVSDEMDLALLKLPSHNMLNCNYIDIKCFNKMLPELCSSISFYTRTIVSGKRLNLYNLSDKSDKSVTRSKRSLGTLPGYTSCNITTRIKKYSSTVNGIKFYKQQSLNMPQLPFITTLVDKLNYNTEYELCEISGSIVTDDNNNIVGIMSNIIVGSREINIIPSISIHRLLDEYIKTHKFMGLCDIIALYTKNKLEINNETFYGLMINNNFNINYNSSVLKNSKYGYNLKNNDIIYSVDGKKINKNLCIRHDSAGIMMPVSTYIALKYMSGDMIQMMVYRPNIFNKKINIIARSVLSAKYIPAMNNHIYYRYHGLILMELSEEFIEMYSNNGYLLSKYINKYMIEYPYRDNNNEKIVVLIDINRKDLSYDNIILHESFNIPIIHLSDNNYDVFMLTKINKKKVMNINAIDDLLTSNKNVFVFSQLGTSKVLKLTYGESLEMIKILD